MGWCVNGLRLRLGVVSSLWCGAGQYLCVVLVFAGVYVALSSWSPSCRMGFVSFLDGYYFSITTMVGREEGGREGGRERPAASCLAAWPDGCWWWLVSWCLLLGDRGVRSQGRVLRGVRGARRRHHAAGQ